MTINHGLDMGAPATADQVGDALAEAAIAQNLVTTGTRFELPGARLRNGLFIVNVASTPLPFPDPVEEEFGFAPTANVVFHPDQDADPIEQRQDMIRLVVAVLAAVPGDAWLAFEGEITRLVRVAGKLTISMEDGFWVPEVVDLLPAHDRAPLPNL